MELTVDRDQTVDELEFLSVSKQTLSIVARDVVGTGSTAARLEVATLGEVNVGHDLMQVGTITSTARAASVVSPFCNNIDQDTAERVETTLAETSCEILPLNANQTGLNMLDMRMLIMRERFKKLEELDDGEPNADQSPGPATSRKSEDMTKENPTLDSPLYPDANHLTNHNLMTPAVRRWSRVKKAVQSPGREEEREQTLSVSASVSKQKQNSVMNAYSTRSDILSDISRKETIKETTIPFSANDNEQLMAFWDDRTMPIPPLYCPVEATAPDGEWTERDTEGTVKMIDESLPHGAAFNPPPIPSFETNFEEESRSLTLLINRVPKDLILKQKKIMETELQEEQQRNALEFQRKESDIIWRERLARQRIIQVESSTRARLDSEREKSLMAVDEKEKKIGRDFRRARENLEIGVKRQLVSIHERFGEILIAGASLARKYGVQSTHAPQPVEVRVHFLRAVKMKLPKGKYVMMLTQYESLGGNPIGWSKVGTYGIGRSRAATTLPVFHNGRYFDRTLKFEDSCYALCPPTYMMKPSFVFILELFHIASWSNPIDRVVAWAALPMCNEHMSISAGKFRLPMLRGEQNPSVEHFRSIEKAMSEDLNNWLCNMYIEVRCMSLDEVSDVDLGGFKESRLDYDFINRQVVTDTQDPVFEGEEKEKKKEKEKEVDRGIVGYGDQRVDRRRILKASSYLFHPPNTVTNILLERPENHTGGNNAFQKIKQENDSSDVLSDKMLINKVTICENSDIDRDEGKKLLAQGSLKAKVGRVSFVSPGGNSVVPVDSDVDEEQGWEVDDLVSNVKADKQKQAEESLCIDKELFRRKTSAKAMPTHSKGRRGSAVAACDSETYGEVQRQHEAEEEGLIRSDISSKKYEQTNSKLGSRGQSRISTLFSFLPIAKEGASKGEVKGLLDSRTNSSYRKYREGDSDGDSSSDGEVFERGYGISEEFYLNQEQRGKLSGLETVKTSMTGNERKWASVGLEGSVVRRWHSDGPRFDSEAINTMSGSGGKTNDDDPNTLRTSKFDPLRLSPSYKSPFRGRATFLPLEDQRDMETYTMSLASDPSQRRHLLPQAVFATKIRFLRLETFGELAPYMWGSMRFWITLLMFLFTFWLRLYVHYVAQYMYLQALRTPVYGFQLQPILVVFKYMSSSITLAQEIGVVAIGPITNIIIFIVLAALGRLFFLFASFLPDVFSKFIACYGIATILDPLLLFIVDIAYHNYDCSKYNSSCMMDYTSNSCPCFNGDFIKLFNRTVVEEGSGVTGAILMLIVYIICSIVSTLLLYEYLVYVHKDARILDLWRRVKGPSEEFFIPDDFEVSHSELLDVCSKADSWRGPNGATRKVVVCTYEELDPLDLLYNQLMKHYVIYELDADGKKTLYRHFLLQHTGCLVELFEQYKSKLSAQRHIDNVKRVLQHSNDNVQLNGLFGSRVESCPLAAVLNPLHTGERGLFAGLESA